jgi:hypothetical protein
MIETSVAAHLSVCPSIDLSTSVFNLATVVPRWWPVTTDAATSALNE